MVRNVVLIRMPADADAAAYAELDAGLAGIAGLQLPGLRGHAIGRDAGLRAGGWTAAISNDWETPEDYQRYDLDEEHNRYRAQIVAVAEEVARVQLVVAGSAS